MPAAGVWATEIHDTGRIRGSDGNFAKSSCSSLLQSPFKQGDPLILYIVYNRRLSISSPFPPRSGMNSQVAPRLVFSLREQIVEQLRNDLLAGRFAEGERLSEASLTARFGVSRTPVREALQQLVQEGLLEGKPNVGVTVAHRPPDAIRDLVVPIRRSVEEFALRSFYHDLGPDDFRRWEEILERMRQACEARDSFTVAEQDVAFHRSIVRRAGQSDLEQIWTTLVARMRPHFVVAQSNYPDLVDIHREHQAILKVFRRGEVEPAVEALMENIS